MAYEPVVLGLLFHVQQGIVPKTTGFRFETVSSINEADKLEAAGLLFRSCAHKIRPYVRRGIKVTIGAIAERNAPALTALPRIGAPGCYPGVLWRKW